MKNWSLLFTFFFLLFSLSVVAQKYKLLKGKVSHPNLSVAGIHVVNVSRGSTEITDMMGNFEISVAVGERILLSGVQFKDYELIVSEAIFSSDEITVYMKTAINQLDEVVVKPHDLSGSLANDLQSVPKSINFTDVGIPGFKGEREEKIVSGTSLILTTLFLPLTGGLNVDAIYKHFSGYYKRLKKRRQLDVEFEAIFAIIKFYGLLFFQTSYGLNEAQVYDFVLACSENTPIISLFKKNRHQEVISHFEVFHKQRYGESK